MPERYVSVRWPDGQAQRIYSPSTVVEDYFEPGQSLPVAEFVARSHEALQHASDRVEAAYGFPCGNAAREMTTIAHRAERYADGVVTVDGIDEA